MHIRTALVGGIILIALAGMAYAVWGEPPALFVPSTSQLEGNVPRDLASTTSAVLATVCVGEKSADFDCLETYYESLVTDKGVKAAFDDLKARYPKNAYVRAQCHPLTHVIGRGAALASQTVSEAYLSGDSFCWSGYYHGVLETYVARVGLQNLPKRINDVCKDIPGKSQYSFDYYNCVHGLGHGVMAITEDELFDSLKYCRYLTGGWEQQSCASGVYMENIIADGRDHQTKYLKKSDPLYPCNASLDLFKNTCYLMQTSYILTLNGDSFKDTFATCRTAEAPYRATCYQSLGRDASGHSTSDVARTNAICLLGRDYAEQSNCVIGAVKDFVSYFHSDTQAYALCDSFKDASLATLCRSTAESYYKQF